MLPAASMAMAISIPPDGTPPLSTAAIEDGGKPPDPQSCSPPVCESDSTVTSAAPGAAAPQTTDSCGRSAMPSKATSHRPPTRENDGSMRAALPSHAAAPQSTDDCRRSAMLAKQTTSHRSFFASTRHHTLSRSQAKRGLFSDFVEEEDDDENDDDDDGGGDCYSDSGFVDSSAARPPFAPQEEQEQALQPQPSRSSLWRTRTMRFFSHNSNSNITGQQQEAHPASYSQTSQPPPLPESEVERIVQRLELRKANRVPVPAEVKNRFLRLCKNACQKRREILLESSIQNNNDDEMDARDGIDTTSRISQSGGSSTTNKNGGQIIVSSLTCILRSDVIQIRQAIRLEVEGRTKPQRLSDGIKAYFGFRCHCKVLLHVLNRAVDFFDENGRDRLAKKNRRISNITVGSERNLLGSSINSSFTNDVGGGNLYHPSAISFENNDGDEKKNIEEDNIDDEKDWFYYKDFAFYSLKIESNYPWMRNAGVFSILTTVAFYLFTPIFWCEILNDPNICPSSANNERGWLSALFFASATMSTVGYGDVTVFVGANDTSSSNEPETWRIFIAILFMILSLVVSVVGFQAGLDSQFHPFRRRLDFLSKRVYEILRDANIVKGKHDKHEDIRSRMRWSTFAQLAEICLIFLILNLVGVFVVQLSLLGEEEDEFGDKLSISWMESFYWAVQTTTTIGYGDIDTPESLRWFLLVYLAISTYFVGSAFGKLGELSKKLESMHQLYRWQQQEASYTMLQDFSGRPDSRDERTLDEGDREILDFEPEIDQFEFTIASLVVMGKITSEDVKPILEKFQRLTGENSNKITSADVSGPMRKKKDNLPEPVEGGEQEDLETDANEISLSKSSSQGALVVGKRIAKAFREEMLSSSVNHGKDVIVEEKEKVVDYSDFCIPKNTYAIAIDDSKIQRKLLGKIFDNAGISPNRCTICGDGYYSIMGFEDYVVKLMESQDGYVFMIVDENLDFVDEESSKHSTISGSQCVENIRRRIPHEVERRMFALIRSANDSSSDIAIYKTRAHGFLPKAPIKREKMNETLAPLWRERFPPSEFGESIGIHSRNEYETASSAGDIACTPYDIAQKLIDIDSLFKKDAHFTNMRIIYDSMHELKGDLLTLNSNISVHSVVGQINLIQITQAPETVVDRWQTLRCHINDIIQSLQKNFRIPNNTYALAIDDSKIQRKLLAKFFDFLNIPKENCTIVGDGCSEVNGFEDLVVSFMQNHRDDYVLMIVDENLDVVDESKNESVFVSGSQCVDNIRKRLPVELERRMLALVRSANDSSTDIAIFNERAHGFLPKAPIRRERVIETLAPLWMKRFPPSEFGDSAAFDMTDETISIASEELACTPYDIAQKLMYIDSLFKKEAHINDMRILHDPLHQLKGDLLTLNSDASMIPILGMTNLVLLGHKSPDAIVDKWHALRDRIRAVINSLQNSSNGSEGQSATLGILKRSKKVESMDSPVMSSIARRRTIDVSSRSNEGQSTLGILRRSKKVERIDSPVMSSITRRKSLLSNSAVSTCSSKLSDD